MDRAGNETDAMLREMEKHIRGIYEQSRDELTVKWDAYMERGRKRLDDLYAAYTAAPPGLKADRLKKYQDALRNFTFRNEWYRQMVNETVFRLAHVNEIALDYVNGRIPSIYAVNFNYVDPDALAIRNTWSIRSEHMVRNLFMDSLPQKTLNYPKDMAWNTRQINSAVLQGVLQGESIDKISHRIFPVITKPGETDKGIIHKNEIAARRMARTMVTGAENRGRLDRYREYEEAGVEMTKVWIATPDHRVRNWHLSMDGQEVGVDEQFTDGHGNPISYPGAPDGAADSIYNCRCSMRSHILGVRLANGKINPIKNYRTEPGLHQRQIEAEKERRGKNDR